MSLRDVTLAIVLPFAVVGLSAWIAALSMLLVAVTNRRG